VWTEQQGDTDRERRDLIRWSQFMRATISAVFAMVLAVAGSVPVNAQSAPAPAAQSSSRAQQLMGDVDPKLAELTDRVLYGDVWERPELSKRDRSLVTVAALIVLNRPDQLRSHMTLALKNGVTSVELTETVTQMAFYSGWPSAVSAVPILREVIQAK
jgi:4-carboxymuconolactone decarboxylase